MTRLRWSVALLAVLVSAWCTLRTVRTVLDWRADALRWRGSTPTVMDTLAVRAALAARDRARADAARADARLDSALAALRRRPGARSGETRGPVTRQGAAEGTATVARPADTGATTCDELADACAAFQVAARQRAAADSAAHALERADAQATIAAERRALAGLRIQLADTVRALRPRWWRPTVTVGAACVASGIVTCGPGVALGWRIR